MRKFFTVIGTCVALTGCGSSSTNTPVTETLASFPNGAGVFRKDIVDPKIDQILEKNFQLAQALNITGTPAFIIGDQIIPGAIDEQTMKKMISAAGG